MKNKGYQIFLGVGMLSLAVPSLHAATVVTSILSAPTATTYTNSHSAPYVGTMLHDGTAPTVGDIGTNRGAADGGQWAVANSNNGAEYIVYDMGASVSFASILYSQTSWGETNYDWNWSAMTVWVSNIDPGLPNTDSGAGEAAADAARAGLVNTYTLSTGSSGQNLNQYDLTGDGSNLSGRYVTFKFAPISGVASNPGGQDLWLGAAVPEPGAALLGGIGLLGLLRRRRFA